MDTVFVYGTLRWGERNHRLLSDANCVARIAYAKGSLIDTAADYPAMYVDSDDVVVGELYEVNDQQFKSLDELEGFYQPNDPRNHYERIQIEVQTDRGAIEAWVYVYQKDRTAETIPFGDWKLYRMCQKENLLYYAYGSCMDTERIELAGKLHWFEQVEGRGILEGFNLQFTYNSKGDGGKADVVETGGHVEGKLYTIPTEALEGYLYMREGVYSNIYRPAIVPLHCEDGTTREALTFIVVTKVAESTPSTKYMLEILRGSKPVVSEEYYNALYNRFVNEFGYEDEGDL